MSDIVVSPILIIVFLLLSANLDGLLKKKAISKDKMNSALSLLNGTLDYSEFRDIDMVIEVIFFVHSTFSCQSTILYFSTC